MGAVVWRSSRATRVARRYIDTGAGEGLRSQCYCTIERCPRASRSFAYYSFSQSRTSNSVYPPSCASPTGDGPGRLMRLGVRGLEHCIVDVVVPPFGLLRRRRRARAQFANRRAGGWMCCVLPARHAGEAGTSCPVADGGCGANGFRRTVRACARLFPQAPERNDQAYRSCQQLSGAAKRCRSTPAVRHRLKCFRR